MKQTATLLPGLPYPLGATWDGDGINFALFSAHAERVERERADYEARVAACLAGEREFCAPR